MQRLGLTYYAGLLTAAQYHGAAHHRPQEFQVMLEKSRRPIVSGSVRVTFIVRKNISATPVQSFDTPRGTVLVSTPEATAVDVVGYPDHVGGLDQAATILGELAENLNAEKLVAAVQTAPIPWAQRLGYLLVKAGAGERTEALKSYVQQHARQTAVLLPTARSDDAARDDNWKLIVNAEVEALAIAGGQDLGKEFGRGEPDLRLTRRNAPLTPRHGHGARIHLLVAGDAHLQGRHGITPLSRNTAATVVQKSTSKAAASRYS